MKPSPCANESVNWLAGRSAEPSASLFAPEKLTDGVMLPEGYAWHSREASFVLLTGDPVIFDLGKPATISFVRLQADHNDELFVDFSDDKVIWRASQFLPPVAKEGLRLREVSFAPQTARFLRVRVGYSDDLVAISEVEAYCAPTPSSARVISDSQNWYRNADVRQGLGAVTPFLVYGLLTLAALAWCLRRRKREPTPEAWKTILDRAWFTLDLRSLGLFRIVLATYLLYDWAGRVSVFPLFFSTEGWIPPPEQLYGTSAWFPFGLLHSLNNDGAMVGFFAVTGLAYLALLVGFFTPVAHALSAACLVLLHTKVWALNHGGHMVLRLLVIWTLFLPLGAFYSFDSRAKRAPAGTSFRSRLVFPLLLQLASIYLFNALSKFSGDWTSGNFSQMVLKVSCTTTPLGQWVAGWLPWWMGRVSTWGSVWAEAMAPFLLLFPLYARQCRRSIFFLLFGLHAAFGMLMYVRDFSLSMICFLFLFFPYEDLPRISWRPRWKLPNLARLGAAVSFSNKGYRLFTIFVAIFAVASASRLIRGNFPLSHWLAHGGLAPLDTLVGSTQTLQEWCMFGSCGTTAVPVKNEEIVTIVRSPIEPSYDPLCRAFTGRDCLIENGLMPPFPKVTAEPWTNYIRNLFARHPAYLEQLRQWLERERTLHREMGKGDLNYTVYKLEQPIVDPAPNTPAPLFRMRVLESTPGREN